MKMWVALVAALIVPVSAAAQNKDPIAGAWEQVASKNIATGQMQQQLAPPLHVIYADGHYAQFRAEANRAKTQTPRAELTKEELLERTNMQGQYGTYRVTGNKLQRRIISAADPNNEGRETTSEFRMEGDVLVVTGTNPQGQATENRFRRLRQGS